MRFGFAIPAYGSGVDGPALVDVVVAAEELGYDSAWLPDHVAVPEYAAAVNLTPPFLEPLAACAWGLGVTTRLRFGTDVLVAPYRHPLVVAAMTGTMIRLAGDRLVLGVGIGYLRGEFEVLGADYEARAATTEEWIRALREPPEGFSVVQGASPVPVWVGGNNPRALRRAALLGDGWHPLWLPAEDYASAREQIPRHPSWRGHRRAVHVLVQRRLHPLRRGPRGRLAPTRGAGAGRFRVPLRAGGLDRTRRPTPTHRIARRPDRRPPAARRGRRRPRHAPVRHHRHRATRTLRTRGHACARLSGAGHTTRSAWAR